MVFKTDKNFVAKVALRGFTPPQLLRQFCLRQNRFYGLKRKLLVLLQSSVLFFKYPSCATNPLNTLQ